MKLRNFPALAATLFLGTAIYASVATSSVYAFPPRSTHIIVENLSDSDERERGVTKLENGLDLSRRDLAGVRITDAFLRDVDFSDSNLTGGDAPKSRLVFPCRSVIFDLAFDDKTSLKEAEAVRRYITETLHKACNKLAMPAIYGR